ncbi:MAG: hypothetical protein H6592_04005 [Flavobacteriales bacterium]|nr:hypothetical protein [Flavobacteriales bacterium]
MDLQALLKALLQNADWLHTAATVAVALVTFLITRSIWLGVERWMAGNYERRVFIQELEDIVEHLGANIVVLSSIDLVNGYPSTMHLLKCKIPEGSMLFDLDSFRKLRPEHASAVYHAKLMVRNANIEADTVVERCMKLRGKARHGGNAAIVEMPAFIQYLISKQITTRKLIEQCIGVLKGARIDTREEGIPPITIVYE